VTLPTQYQQFIHLSRYSRWDYEKNRRETWEETVNRYFNFFAKKLDIDFTSTQTLRDLVDAVKNLDVMPSMRCLMTAGPALEKENVAGYNCSYVHIDSPRSFDEIVYILMNGTGVGFSVEEKFTSKLPVIPDKLHKTDTKITVRDSKLGWAKAFKDLIALLYAGVVPDWDTSKVRPAGSVLKTFGGRASGPEPLESLFNFTVRTFENARGRKLKPIECHDIVCKAAEVVVVGVILVTNKCGRRKVEDGGTSTHTEHSQTIQQTITPSLTREHSLMNGLPFTSQSLENVVSTRQRMLRLTQKNLEIEEMLEKTSVPIHVPKSFYDPDSSAIYQK
jgi:hypothetical protein